MFKLIFSILISSFLLLPTTLTAYEDDVKPLMVPLENIQHEIDADEAVNNEMIEDASAIRENTEEVVEEVPVKEMQKDIVSSAENQHEATIDSSESSTEKDVDNNTESIENQGENEVKSMNEASENVEKQNTETTEQPSEEELEAKHAEEAELQEVGAGEEPIAE